VKAAAAQTTLDDEIAELKRLLAEQTARADAAEATVAEQAAEIERLEAENEELRAQLAAKEEEAAAAAAEVSHGP
jgi:regulator of replication initiation timing